MLMFHDYDVLIRERESLLFERNLLSTITEAKLTTYKCSGCVDDAERWL